MSTDQILREAMGLPAEEKAKLAEELLASLDGPEQQDVDAAWALEAEARIDALEAAKIKTEPAQDVLRALKDRKR
jgi:putative addiction module component (TIGR02574 family)